LLLGKALRRQPAQLVVDQGQELAGGVWVALVDRGENPGDFTHWRLEPVEGLLSAAVQGPASRQWRSGEVTTGAGEGCCVACLSPCPASSPLPGELAPAFSPRTRTRSCSPAHGRSPPAPRRGPPRHWLRPRDARGPGAGGSAGPASPRRRR